VLYSEIQVLNSNMAEITGGAPEDATDPEREFY